MFPLEIIDDDDRLALTTSEVTFDLPYQLQLITGSLTIQGIALDILVKQLMWVKLRTIAMKEEHPNMFLITPYPVFHLDIAVHRVTVGNEVSLEFILSEQTSQKFQENLGSKAFFENHEV